MAENTRQNTHDPRIHVDAAQLRRLGAQSRALSLLPRQPAQSVLNGRHASRLRGRGLNFEELRNYLPGDDVRSIDWKVTARTGEPHVRVYTEERDRPALLLVDQRMSMFFGSRVCMKSVVAAEAAAIVAHRILDQGDRVGGIVFGDDTIAEHVPQRRAAALHRLLGSIVEANAQLHAGHQSVSQIALNDVLRAAVRIAKTNNLLCIFSDFDGLDTQSEKLLRRLAQSNDLILFHVADPTSTSLPDNLRMAVSDGDVQADLDTSHGDTRARVDAALRGRLDDLYSWSRTYGFPLVPLTTEQPALDQLLRLFGHIGRAR
ncbi:MAG: hypothetical protein ACI8R4_001544 [Paracoccaceae bacterium]|jgi:uncharacterized protein (DUF58 family)